MTQIVELIAHGRVADIGTDHAYTPIFAVLGGQADYVLGCDIVPGPLSAAEKNAVAHLERILQNPVNSEKREQLQSLINLYRTI